MDVGKKVSNYYKTRVRVDIGKEVFEKIFKNPMHPPPFWVFFLIKRNLLFSQLCKFEKRIIFDEVVKGEMIG